MHGAHHCISLDPSGGKLGDRLCLRKAKAEDRSDRLFANEVASFSSAVVTSLPAFVTTVRFAKIPEYDLAPAKRKMCTVRYVYGSDPQTCIALLSKSLEISRM